MKTFNNIILMTAKVLLVTFVIGLVTGIIFILSMAAIFPNEVVPRWFTTYMVMVVVSLITSLILFAIRYISIRAILGWITKSE